MRRGECAGWVLVTGAASGIGRATALAFARAGANLVLVDIDDRALQKACDEVLALGRDCATRVVNVADAKAMADLARWVRSEIRIPALDVLVNNAGIGYLGSFMDTPVEAWERVLQVNLMGVVNGCRAFLPDMVGAGGERRIVNVASLAGLVAAPNMSAYAAVKHAVVGLGESLCLELKLKGAQVGVTTVCPGIINTQITKARASVAASIGDAQYERLTAYYAKQGGRPDVVADAIVRGVRQRRELVLVGPFAAPLYYLRRCSRRLAQRLMLQDARRVGFV
ncbi:oxidoreductase [Pseudoxanthomonas sangjuensis]|uniref:SDR family NAD(P)-dependent oxidoreductase n=1 Tax=Pseudoxanthomonas sangjuensis TaxID=1503750 RepID=UPI0013909C5B|nr:SDR family NAD(P)-dependent oxidoreductase [Pseudoxanthomonas sangjuensis]KAF1708743.1 oxidoreductase [Pseudoxanthomonas sangjuensis]